MNAYTHSSTVPQAPQSEAEAPPRPQAPLPQSTLDAARAYVYAGLDVYPVWQDETNGRKPKSPGCGHGYKDATRDPATIAGWWAPGSNLGVAIRTGLIAAGKNAGKYLVAIDIDRAKREGDSDGEAKLQSWLDGEIDGVRHTLPETLEATSWSGGKHLYYVSDTPRGCTANADLHIDVRCTGGGIVAAPTRIAMSDGRSGSYSWVGGFDPDRIAEADAEVEALLDLVFDKRASLRGKTDAQVCASWSRPYVAPKHVPCGSRHDALVRHAAHLQALAYADDDIVRRMYDFCERVCEQPEGDEVTEDELWGVIVWALSKPKGSELTRRLAAIEGAEHGGESESNLRDEDGDDAPSAEDDRVHNFIKSTIDAYKVYEEDKKGKVTFHPERLTEAFIRGFHGCAIDGAPAIWNGEKYVFGIDKYAYFMEIACPRASATANAGAIKKVRARLAVERRFDLPSPRFIRFENGVYDCKSGRLTPASEDSWRSRIPNPIPHPLDLAAPPADVVDKFLDLLSDGHADVRRNLLQTLFLAITRYTYHEQMIVLLGDGGNGKSKYVDVLLNIVGPENASFLSLGRMRNRFEIGDLAGSAVNFSSDISSEYLTGDGASTWKQVTGHDVVKADVKNQDGFVFRPYCQVIVVGNSFPRIEGGIDKATARRIHIIPFTHSFRDANGEYSSDADPKIVEKMGEPAAVAYLIRLAVEEGQRMLAQSEFRLTPNYASQIEVKKLALENSSVLAWVDHVGLTDEDLHMQRRQTVYDRYTAWCKRSALKPVSSDHFIEELGKHFPGLELVAPRATRHDADESGRLGAGRLVQYRAFSIERMAASDRANNVHYVEITGRREVITSVSYSESGDRRENLRVEEVNFGVLPASSLPAPSASGQITIPQSWWDDIERFEG